MWLNWSIVIINVTLQVLDIYRFEIFKMHTEFKIAIQTCIMYCVLKFELHLPTIIY